MNAFLTGTALARLSYLRADGWPSVIPMWYHWDGHALWFVGRKRAAWCLRLVEDSRAAVVIDAEGEFAAVDQVFLTPKVVFHGRVEVVEAPGAGTRWVELAMKMAARYRGQSGIDYVEATRHEQRWLIRLRPSERTSWEGGGWASRYSSRDDD